MTGCAFQTDIALPNKVLGGLVRNLKNSNSPYNAQSNDWLCISDRHCSAEQGVGRAGAELKIGGDKQ